MSEPYHYSTTRNPVDEAVYDWKTDTVRLPSGGAAEVDASAHAAAEAIDRGRRDAPVAESVAARSLVDPFGEDTGSTGDPLDEAVSFGVNEDESDDELDAAEVGDDDPDVADAIDGWEADDNVAYDDDEEDEEAVWDRLADIDLPDFDEDASLVVVRAHPVDRMSDAEWRERWVEEFVMTHGPFSRGVREFLIGIVEESDNPAASLRPIADLLEYGAEWHEIRACADLREAWMDHGELGTAASYPQSSTTEVRWVDIPLGWTEALHILRAFRAIPTTEETLTVLESLHRKWLRLWVPVDEASAAHPNPELSGPWRYFARFAVDMLERHCDPFYWGELA